MPIDAHLASTGLMLSIIVAAVAVALGMGQWSEFRARDAELTKADEQYFARQDWRRGIGIVLMLLLAIGTYVGSRIPYLITEFPYDAPVKQAARALAGAWVQTWIVGRVNPPFFAVWLAMIVLLVTLLALAFFDWQATRRYAHRQLQSIARERLELLREPDVLRNGHPPEPGTTGE